MRVENGDPNIHSKLKVRNGNWAARNAVLPVQVQTCSIFRQPEKPRLAKPRDSRAFWCARCSFWFVRSAFCRHTQKKRKHHQKQRTRKPETRTTKKNKRNASSNCWRCRK